MQSSSVQVPCKSGSPHGVFGCTQVFAAEGAWGACASAGWVASSTRIEAADVIAAKVPGNRYLTLKLLSSS